MKSIIIWHNPRCSKSREGLKVIEENGCEYSVVKYLETVPTKDELKDTLKLLGMDAKALMRTKEAVYKELNLKDEMNEGKLIDAMLANPKLIERPIIFKGEKAIIGRPTSIIEAFLKS